MYANWLSHGGDPGLPGVAGRSREGEANPTVAFRGRACQVSRDLCTLLKPRLLEQLERALCAPPQPGEEQERGGRVEGWGCWLRK